MNKNLEWSLTPTRYEHRSKVLRLSGREYDDAVHLCHRGGYTPNAAV